LAGEILEEGGRLRFSAHGRSMYPFVRDGDIVTVESVQGQDLNVGEIAFFFRASDVPVMHRVVGFDEDNGRMILKMQGDAGSNSAETVNAECVLGKVIQVERDGRPMPLASTDYPIRLWLWRIYRRIARRAAWFVHIRTV